jgi:hypothetical protein
MAVNRLRDFATATFRAVSGCRKASPGILSALLCRKSALRQVKAFLAQNFWRMAPVTELRALALMLLHHAASERSEAVGEGFDFMTIHNGQVEWEHFAAKDPEIESLRLAFSNAVESVLFPSTRK